MSRIIVYSCVVLFLGVLGGCPVEVTLPGFEGTEPGDGLVTEVVRQEAPLERAAEPSRPEPPQPEPQPEPPTPENPKPGPDAAEPPQPEPLAEPSKPDVSVELPPERPIMSGLGAPCQTDADCGGAPLFCVPEGMPAQFPFPQSGGKGPPGGYCTHPCIIGGSTACPSGGACYVPGAASGSCLKLCQSESDCRANEGYTCQQVDASNKGCFPPTCALTQPGGTYWVTVTASRTKGSCASMPQPQGTRWSADITVQGGDIIITFGSKPGSSLPVTWPLSGTYQSGAKMALYHPKNCTPTQTCDGTITTRIGGNMCLFYGALENVIGSNCTHEYDVTFSKR